MLVRLLLATPQDKKKRNGPAPYVQDNVTVASVEKAIVLLGDRDDLELFNAPNPETSLGTDTSALSPGLLERTFFLTVSLFECAAKFGQVGLLELYDGREIKIKTMVVRFCSCKHELSSSPAHPNSSINIDFLTPGRVLEHLEWYMKEREKRVEE